MSYIHWDTSPYDAVDDGIYFTVYGIQVPTYGLNGGANWTDGQIGGSTLDANGHPLQPAYVDRIDRLFWDHDQAYDFNPTADVLPEADLKLATQLVKLNDHQLSDPEASFYAGITTLAMLYRVEQSDPGLISPLQAVYFTADANHNIAVGLAGMDTYEQLQAAELLAQFTALLLDNAVPAPDAIVASILQPTADASLVVVPLIDSGSGADATDLFDGLHDQAAHLDDVVTSVVAHWAQDHWFA